MGMMLLVPKSVTLEYLPVRLQTLYTEQVIAVITVKLAILPFLICNMVMAQ